MPGAREFFKGDPKIHFQDQLLVVLEMNKKRELAEAGQFFAEKPHVFARRPRVNDIRPAPIRENLRPFAIHPIESMNGIILFTEAGATFGIIRNGNRGGVPKRRQLIGEIMDMNGAVRAEVVIKNEKNVAHAERRL